ncbi:FAD-binding protein [Pseudomonas fluorescens]|uniref:FAD-binding protein n=1 Tax=Pseudomonas fluorescens TaxID=294 RepID=UPI001FD5C3CB|nr:FAD-binding protein [Pseudomonas fluorescens]
MAFDLITSSDPRHSTLQKGFNLRWPLGNQQGESSPNGANRIYLCHSPQDIVDAAAEALAVTDGRITVRSGGHCYEGFVSNKMPGNGDEVLSILDISPLNQVVYAADGQIASQLVPARPERYGFRLEAGAQNWDAYVRLYKLANKTLPGGSCYSVGLGGHICGGGYGLLSRKHGLVCDWLHGVDMLVPNAQGTGLTPVHVSRDSTAPDELDLFAACCGAGGGQFGIITSYYFKALPEAPKEVLWLVLEWDWSLLTDKSRLDNLLIAYQNWFAVNQRNPDTWGLATKLEMRHLHTGNVTLGIHYVRSGRRAGGPGALRGFRRKNARGHWPARDGMPGAVLRCAYAKRRRQRTHHQCIARRISGHAAPGLAGVPANLEWFRGQSARALQVGLSEG